jgi:predicted Rossmann fold flavoprotein
MPYSVIVVGGGAAGLLAAGRAAELGAKVLLLEKMHRLGNKLRLSGGGRCNLTHACSARELVAQLSPQGAFLRNVVERFSPDQLRDWLLSQGVPTLVETDGRVFPASRRAEDVIDALQRYALTHGAQLQTHSTVSEICVEQGMLQGVRLEDGAQLEASALILATGGLSYPHTGSTGDGYRMATAVGHSLSTLGAGLVPLCTADKDVRSLKGVAMPAVKAELLHGQQRLAIDSGEILFTHFGLSGPLILKLSLWVGRNVADAPFRLRIDLLPHLMTEQLDEQWRRAGQQRGKATCKTILRDLLPASLADVVLQRVGLPASHQASQLTNPQRQALVHCLKGFEVTIVGTRSIKEAFVTVGGIKTDEVEPRTLCSRLVQGLYFAGELLDMAGPTGGYNLHIAFATGWVAGESAARWTAQGWSA